MLKTRIIAAFLLIAAALIGWMTYYSQVNPNSAIGRPFKLGLDLNGGTHLVYKADVSNVAPGEINSSMQALRDVIEKRVNMFGVGEPIVQVEQGGVLGSADAQYKLIVELPGVTDIDQAVKSIGATPVLEFKTISTADLEKINTLTLSDQEKLAQMQALFTPTGITGRMLEKAVLEFNQNTGEPIVSLNFTAEGRALFAKVTKENVGNIVGIFLDGVPVSLPRVQEEIRDGRAQISGAFTLEEAKLTVRDLNYGALPVPIGQPISTQTVGASLGQSALGGGIRAGVLSLIIIGIFLVIWYRLPGFVAVVSLGVYTVIMLALFKLIPVTLTAAGIAAFILSIGMAVDANILIFERMKEELRRGKGISEAMHEGFARAWLSIRDSNTSSIITGVILYYFGSTSVVTGFALVFVVGVLVSMFSAITASRIFLYAIAPKNTTKLSTFLISNGFTRGLTSITK